MSNAALYALVVAVAVPWVMAAINRQAWPSTLKFALVALACALASAGWFVANDRWDSGDWFGMALLTVVEATALFKLWHRGRSGRSRRRRARPDGSPGAARRPRHGTWPLPPQAPHWTVPCPVQTLHAWRPAPLHVAHTRRPSPPHGWHSRVPRPPQKSHGPVPIGLRPVPPHVRQVICPVPPHSQSLT
jgi:hypothetical protein